MIFQSFLISLMSNLVAQEFPNHSYRFQKYDLAQKLHCSQKRKYDAVPHFLFDYSPLRGRMVITI